MHESSLLAPLITPPPTLSQEAAELIARDAYGVIGLASPLASERDQNFRITADTREQFVLRIANRAEAPEVTDLQARALVHLEATAPELPVQRVMRTRDGTLSTSTVARDGHRYTAWLVSYLPGNPLRSIEPTAALRASLGATLARLDLALMGFEHPTAERELAWDLQRANALKGLLAHVADPTRRGLAEQFLDRFERHASPQLGSLRAQVIHNDFNPSNLLVDSTAPERLSGILDLGDMVRAPRIADVAVAAAYHVGSGEDPLAGPGDLVAGYHALNPLSPPELAILLHLIGARLAMTIAITEWRARLYPQNQDHILKNNASSWRALERLRSVSPADALKRFAAVCGLESPARARIPAVRAARESDSPESLQAKRQRLLGPAYRLFYNKPLHIVRGEGVWLYDSDGRVYLDAYNNVPHVGHCHPKVVSALCSQASVLNTHTRYLHETVLHYAERINAKVSAPSTVMFTCTGSEANDLALRIARACTGNIGVIATANAYHGNTLAVADFSSAYASAEKRSAHIRTVPAPDRFRRPAGVDDESLGEAYAQHVGAAIESLQAQGIGVAAFIADSIFSSDGILDAPPDYLRRSIELVRRAGGLFIADEVQGGFARTGTDFWSFERFAVTPDLISLGKSMGNGHPVAGLIVRLELAEAFGARTRYFNTFGGNPVSSAVGLAVLDVLEEEGLQANASRVGERLQQGLRELAKAHPALGDIRGRGLFVGVDVIREGSNLNPDPEGAQRIVNSLRERGILIIATGPHGNVLKIRPPMPFSEANADQLIETLGTVLREGLHKGAAQAR